MLGYKMRAIAKIFLSLIFFVSPACASSDTEDLRKYVENLINEGYELVHDKTLTESQRYQKTSKLIQEHLNLDWMAKYTLGRNRRIISDDKIAEFIRVYSKFVVKVYADLTNNYNGEKAVLKNIKKVDDDMFIVNTEIVRPSGQQPVKVDYLIHKVEGQPNDPYKIGDIITEGISILNSQQSEFNSVISSRGIDALIEELKKKIEKTAESKQKS